MWSARKYISQTCTVVCEDTPHQKRTKKCVCICNLCLRWKYFVNQSPSTQSYFGWSHPHNFMEMIEARRRQEQKLAKARGQAREREALWWIYLGNVWEPLWATYPPWNFSHSPSVQNLWLRNYCPFGARPIFRGELLVLGRVQLGLDKKSHRNRWQMNANEGWVFWIPEAGGDYCWEGEIFRNNTRLSKPMIIHILTIN